MILSLDRLYRPVNAFGILEFCENMAEKDKYDHPLQEPILARIWRYLYQEQVVNGYCSAFYTPGEADGLRKPW